MTNVLQQGPMDAALGDAQIEVRDRVFLFEFKSEETTEKYGGAISSELAKGDSELKVRPQMRKRLRQIWDHALIGSLEAIRLQDIARRGWWFVPGYHQPPAAPDLSFVSYENTLFPAGTLGLGIVPSYSNVQNFVDAMLMLPPAIGVSRSEAAELLNFLFGNLPGTVKWSSDDELLAITLPSAASATAVATWSVTTVKSFFSRAIPKAIKP